METKIYCTKLRGFAVDYGEGILAAALFVVLASWLIRMIGAMPYAIQSAIATAAIFIVLAAMLASISFVAAESLYELWLVYKSCGWWTGFAAYWIVLIGGIVAPLVFVVYLGIVLKPHDLVEILGLYVGFGLIVTAVYGLFRRLVSGRWYAR